MNDRSIRLRKIGPQDKAEWFRMRKAIWPEVPDEYLGFDMDPILSDERWLVLFAEEGERPVGLIEGHLRDQAEGCGPGPVGYIESWYVDPAWRGRGIAGQLVEAVENWARWKGCREMASDTWLENEAGMRAHEKLGYVEIERLVHYVKRL